MKRHARDSRSDDLFRAERAAVRRKDRATCVGRRNHEIVLKRCAACEGLHSSRAQRNFRVPEGDHSQDREKFVPSSEPVTICLRFGGGKM